MRKFKFLLLMKLSIVASLVTPAQGVIKLRETEGVSLSYTRVPYKTCESFRDHKKNTIYKVTAYLSNKSGKSIKMADSFISHEIRGAALGEDRTCMDMNGLPADKVIFSPNGGVFWDTNNGMIFKNNTTLTATYYFLVPEGGEPWDPAWGMGQFKFIVDNNLPAPEWSKWITNDCYKGLSFQYQIRQLVNLDYQVWYEFKVRNNYKENVSFVLSLKDAKGKERFGTINSVNAGSEMAFIEKMDDNYIKTLSIDKVWFPKDERGGKPAPCDDEREKDAEKNDPKNKSKFDNYPPGSPPSEWSLIQSPGCYGGIGYSVKHNGYLKENKGYRWSIAFHNYYNAPISFYYRMVMKNGDDEATEWLYHAMDPGARNVGGIIHFGGRQITTSEWDHLEVKEICFAGNTCRQTGCYAACDIEDKVPNKNCIGNTGKPGESTNAEKEKEEKLKAEKEENLKNENEDLIGKIQTDINAIPAEGRRSQLQTEFNNIRNSNSSEQARNTQLKTFQNKVNAAAAEVKENIEKFNKEKEQRTEQITDNREKNKEIKKNQAELSAGYASFLAAIFSLKGRTGENSIYRGGSTLFTFNAGLFFIMQPVGYTEYTSGTGINNSTGIRYTISSKEFQERSLVTPGLFLGAEFHPYYSNNFSIGFTGGASFGYWPQFDDGSTTTTSDYSGNSGTMILGFNYGTEITFGLKPVKLLVRYQVQNQSIVTSGNTDYTNETSSYSNQYSEYYSTDQKWNLTRASVGIRIGDYNKSKTYIDLAFTRYVPTTVSGIKTPYTTKNLYSTDSLKAPAGGYIQVSKQNGFYVKAEVLKDCIIFDEELKKTSIGSKVFFNIAVGRNFQWFGKPHTKKTSRKK